MADLIDFPIACPGCGTGYQVPASMAGTPVTCNSCQTDFILPEDLSPASPRPPGPVASASPPKGSGAGWKSLLLILTGAAAVWSLVTYSKNHRAAQDAPGRVPPPAAMAREEAPVPMPEAPEPVITTTRPARVRPLSASPPTPDVGTAATAPADPAQPTDPAMPPHAPQEPEPATAPPTPAAAVAGPAPAPMGQPSPAPAPAPSAPPAAELPPPPPANAIATATAAVSTAPPAGSPPPDFAVIRRDPRLTLEQFLRASSIEERLAVSQTPDKIRPAMEKHYRTWPGGPQPLEELTFLTESEVPETHRKFHLYNVVLKDQEAPIPLAVEETPDGYRVDWPTFAESYTHALRAFFAAPVETPGRFRVMLRRAHYFGPPVPGQDTVRIAYTVEPPMRDESFHVWVEKDSLVYSEKLSTGERAGWDAESYVTVELLWKGDEKRGRWVGLHRIPSDSWRTE